jgi:hypothetical protein
VHKQNHPLKIALTAFPHIELQQNQHIQIDVWIKQFSIFLFTVDVIVIVISEMVSLGENT